jgi:hypothetical protein
MRASEILRKLADTLDSEESAQQEPQQEQPTDTPSIEKQAGVSVATMVPPLQQKLDLMKKLAGVDSNTDEAPCEVCGATPCGCEQGQDELAIMKQNAGIAPVVVAMADEDEPFEG